MPPTASKSFFRVFWQVSFIQIINSACAFLLNVLVTRWLGPAVFGNFYFYLSVAIATNILFDFGLSRTLLRYSPHHQARGEKAEQLAYYAAALDLKTAAGFACLALGVGASYLWGGELKWELILGLATGFIVSYAQFVATVALAEEKYRLYNAALSFNTFRLILICLLAAAGLLQVGALYGVCLLAPLALALIPAWIITRDLRGHVLPDKAGFYRNLIAFGKWMIAIAILDTVYQRTDVILLRWLTTAEQTGYYAGALAFFGLVYMLPAYTATLIYPRLVKALSANDVPAFAHHYRYSTDLVAFTALPLAFGLWAVAPELVDWVIGAKYRAALPLFGYLAFYSVCFSCFLNTGGIFFAQDKPQAALVTVAAGLVINVLANVLLIPRLGIIGAGVAICLASGAALLLAWGLIKYYFGLLPDVKHILGYTGAAALMFWALRLPLGLHSWQALGVKVAAGGLIYLGILWTLNQVAGPGWLPREKPIIPT
jgi:O-antigen/teichoic acid export membrane protein